MSVLPDPHLAWASAALGEEPPVEGEATCHDCPLCDAGRPPREQAIVTASKCCTWTPSLPNFVLGLVLADDTPEGAEGRRRVEALLERSAWGTPLGLDVPQPTPLPPLPQVLAFGRERADACALYDARTGACTIWPHREAACATWFCRHERGAVGMTAWRAIHALLEGIEDTVACAALLELGFDDDALAQLFPTPDVPHGSCPGPAQARFGPPSATSWGTWAGRERELFLRAGAWAAGLTWEDVVRMAGPQISVRARLARRALASLQDRPIPARVVVTTCDALEVEPDHMRLRAYSPFDTLVLPRALWELLPRFGGDDPLAVVDRIRDEEGIDIDEAIISLLLDFQVLVAAPTLP